MEKTDEKSVPVYVVLPEWMVQALDRWAKDEDRTRSNTILRMLKPVVQERLRREQAEEGKGQ